MAVMLAEETALVLPPRYDPLAAADVIANGAVGDRMGRLKFICFIKLDVKFDN